ncbi:MAG: DciA family protein [Ectothiorhodospiraceae bacterium]|jgi:hypothetical protein
MNDGNNRGDRNGRPRRLGGFLRGSAGSLGRISEYAKRTGSRQRALQSHLPRELAGHWQLARLDSDELGIVADSPVWASQLRFRQTELLAASEKIIGSSPRRCRITVDPPRLQRRNREARRQLSPAGAESLRACAGAVEDERLRDALLRLASRGDKGQHGR